MSRNIKSWQYGGAILLIAAVGGMASGQEREPERKEEPRTEAQVREATERGQRERQAAELRERLQQLERQVKELREAGKLDAAEERLREFKQLQEKLGSLRIEERREGDVRGELPAEVREKMEQLRRKLNELREAGKLDAAAEVERELRQLHERIAAELRERRERGEARELPAEARERLDQLKRRHAELREAGKLDEARAVEREAKQLLEGLNASRADGERRESDESAAAQKLRHLRAAVEHLRAAGLSELAAQAADQIGRLERELHQRPEGEQRKKE